MLYFRKSLFDIVMHFFGHIMRNPNVHKIDVLRTRIFGNKIYVDVEIALDGSITLQDAHDVAEKVHNDIEKTFPKVKHIMVHVNPAKL